MCVDARRTAPGSRSAEDELTAPEAHRTTYPRSRRGRQIGTSACREGIGDCAREDTANESRALSTPGASLAMTRQLMLSPPLIRHTSSAGQPADYGQRQAG